LIHIQSSPHIPLGKVVQGKKQKQCEKNGNFFRLIQFSKNIVFFWFIDPVNRLTPLESDLETLLFVCRFSLHKHVDLEIMP
jgi:hypothetical protein